MKMRFLLVLLCACLLLGACTAAPGESQETKTGDAPAWEQEKQPDSTEPPVQAEKEFVKAVYEELPVEQNDFQYGNMQKGNADENFVIYGDQFLVVGGSKVRYIYAYDLATGKAQRFCDIPGCDHSTSDCRLQSLARTNLESYDGKLYSHFYHTPVRVLEDGEWKSLGFNADRAWHAYGDLFTIQMGRLQFYDDGIGEPRTILNDYDYMFNLVIGRYLYSHSCLGLVRVDLLADNPSKEVVMEEVFCIVDRDCIYYVDDAEESATFYLYRCDMDGNNSELLLDQPILPASLNFDDEYIYFRLYTDHSISRSKDGKDIYRMSKADPTQVVKIATLPETAYFIHTVPGEDILFVNAWGKNVYGVRIENVYVMNTDGSNLRMLELP